MPCGRCVPTHDIRKVGPTVIIMSSEMTVFYIPEKKIDGTAF